MKKFKVMLSVFMVVIIILISVVPAFATDTKCTSSVVIKEDLATVMKNSDANEKIKVYIWYKDIDQNEVDVLTTKATGLTPESCTVITEFPSTELLCSLRNGDTDAKIQMDAYMKRTELARETERERTERYLRKHTEIANEKYIQKGENIRKSLSISNEDTEFTSQFAPMIIAEMTTDEINKAVKNTNIEEICLYYDYEDSTPLDCIENPTYKNKGLYAKESLNLNEVYGVYGLTGAGVNVGLIETHIPGPYEDFGADLGFNFSDITVIQDPLSVINPSIYIDSKDHFHANNTVRVMAHNEYGIAKDIKVYASDYKLRNVEALLKGNDRLIDILEVNYAYRIKDRVYENVTDINSSSIPNPTFAYQSLEKYYDHIVSEHNLITVIAGGNWGNKEYDYYYIDNNLSNGDNTGWTAGARVSSPGLAYNAITVGGYHTKGNGSDNDDELSDYSWKDSYVLEEENVAYYGCEKPDVVMPIDFYYGGTSESSPALTATIALMLELKPSLSLHPEAVKAIVLASCHRKALHKDTQGDQETMIQGITERQGAGAPDAWNMVNIICQGTYGYGKLNGTNTTINFEQPPYGAENMNISIAWLRENTDTNTDVVFDAASDIEAGQASNIDLSIYQDDEMIKSSTLLHSSTEMCYVPLSTSDYNYQLKLTQNSSLTSVRYAYAWSTDNMYAPVSTNQDGIYYIKNVTSGRYVTYNTASTTPQAVQRAVSTQSAFNDATRWIIQQNNNAYNISSGYGSAKLFLGQSSTLSGTSQLSAVAQDINILHNDDGTVSFLNSTSDRILTYSGSNLIWTTYNSSTSLLQNKNKWFLEKVNYLCGDANMDGDLETGSTAVNEEGESYALPGLDQIFIQNYLVGKESMNNLQLFLSDIDKDGDVSILDADIINRFAENKYFKLNRS